MNKCVVNVLFLVLLPFGIIGQNKIDGLICLSLKEADSLFICNNLELIAERCNIQIADANILQAKQFENPVISFEENVYNRNSKRWLDFGVGSEQVVSLEQMFYLAGKRSKRVRLEKNNKSVVQSEFEDIVRILRGEFRRKMIELHFTVKGCSVYNKEVENLERLLLTYNEQYSKGNISMIEKTRLHALLSSLRVERNEYMANVINLQGELAVLLGLNVDVKVEVVIEYGVFDDLDSQMPSITDLREHILKRSDVRVAEAQVQVSETNLKVQKSLAYPDVTLFGNYDRIGNAFDNYFGIGISFQLPVFNRNQGNIKAAHIVNEQRNLLQRKAINEAQMELMIVWRKMIDALELYKSFEHDFESEFNIFMEGININFEKRNISMLEFIDYYETYKDSYLNYYTIKKNILLSLEDINCTVGENIFDY